MHVNDTFCVPQEHSLNAHELTQVPQNPNCIEIAQNRNFVHKLAPNEKFEHPKSMKHMQHLKASA